MFTAIPSEGMETSALMAARFARAPYFLVFDENGNITDCIANDSVRLAHGAGGNAVKVLSEKDIDAVIVPQVGPNAAVALKMAQIRVYETSTDTVEIIIQKYIKGDLKELSL